MEVHHHPELPHGKSKHFKEYFLEFLMIFLAVTMGFIAESLREHISDSSKEQEYIAGLVKDMKTDTANLKLIIAKDKSQLKGIDTLRNIPKNKLADIKEQDSLFKYSTKYLFGLDPFKSDDITLIQLRNAGGYRLIRKTGVLDSIALFESQINIIDIQQGFLTTGVTKALDVSNLIFDFNGYFKTRGTHPAAPLLASATKEKIDNLYNQCWMMSILVKNYDDMLQEHLKYTSGLIAYLKKEYDVD